jgi:hypothetical protein
MSRPSDSPQRDRAWARFYARRGAKPILRPDGGYTTNAERIRAWRQRYDCVPLEQQTAPIRSTK